MFDVKEYNMSLCMCVNKSPLSMKEHEMYNYG